jgi:N-carbamoylputrescine amidase
LTNAAKENQVVIIASLFEKRTQGIYHNTTAVIDADGKYLGKYRKMHIPDDPSYYEKFYFTPGDLGYKVFKTKFANIGVLICWDQWYPEAARITSLMGAEILFYPTAIGWASSQDEKTNTEQYNAWQTIQRSHAVANGVHVVSVNRVGIEQNGAMKFWGGSFVSNPFGTVLAQASPDKEEVIIQEIDTEKTDTYRTHWPFLRDRRIDSYQPITNRFIDEEING